MPKESLPDKDAALRAEFVPSVERGGEQPSWAYIESIGRKIANSGWYKDVFGGKSREELDRQRISPDLVAEMVGQLERGRYIGPLETQPISWSDTKIYRDIVQNFFDGMKDVTGRPTLDGVDFSSETHKEKQKGGARLSEFLIQSPAEYDHRYLLHHGGTTKASDESVAGGFGEGLKIASFLLLKQNVTDQIELGSDHWRAKYYLQELPKEEYPEPVRGLYLQAEFVKDGTSGNFLRFKTDEIAGRAIKNRLHEMKDFFWYEGHPDFVNPTYENEFGGFRLLPRDSSGNLYVAGQRYEYGKVEAWDRPVPGAHVWSFKKVLERTRDRNYTTSLDVEGRIIRPLINSMNKDDLLKVFNEGRDYWMGGEGVTNIGDNIIGLVIHRLSGMLPEDEKKELLKKFPDNLFIGSGDKDEYTKMLQSAGFTQCRYELADFGVPRAKEKILSLIDTAKEPKLESWEGRRVEILNRAIQAFIDCASSNIVEKYMKFLQSSADKPSRHSSYGGYDDDDFYEDWGRLSASSVIYQLNGGKVPPLAIRETGSLKLKGGHGSIELHGFTKLFSENIFLQKKLLHGEFLSALFTWAHEYAHNISGADDFTASFTDAERYLHELILITSFSSDELKKLQTEWNSIEGRQGRINRVKGTETEDDDL